MEATLNSLEQLICDRKLDQVEVMNVLQGETNLVSDLCVSAADVAAKDCFRACQFALANEDRLKLIDARRA
jgi:hypothetical protein